MEEERREVPKPAVARQRVAEALVVEAQMPQALLEEEVLQAADRVVLLLEDLVVAALFLGPQVAHLVLLGLLGFQVADVVALQEEVLILEARQEGLEEVAQ